MYWTIAVTISRTTFLWLSILLYFAVFVNAKGCVPGVNEVYGKIIPEGDIILKMGEPLEIICVLNENATAKNCSSKDIEFRRNNDPIDNRYVTVINETASKIHIENMTESGHWYNCFLKFDEGIWNNFVPSSIEVGDNNSVTSRSKEKLICGSLVVVGTEPKDVEYLECASRGFIELYCSWMLPENNVPTNYTILYLRPGRPGIGQPAPCPTNDDWAHQFCRWEMNAYRRNFKYLTMVVTGQNRFGTHKQKYLFHHNAHIKPPTPQNLELVTKTPTSIYFKWHVGEFKYYSFGILYRVQHKRNNTMPWTTLIYSSKNLTFDSNGYVHVNVTNLKPNTLNNFRVYMKTEDAINDTYWSEPGAQIFRTKSCAPFVSPKTDVGSFETEFTASGRHLYVYWQPLSEVEHNGDEFKYDVKAYRDVEKKENNDESKRLIMPILVEYSYAKFEVDFDSYRVLITSVNKEGSAQQSSMVLVPAQKKAVSYFRSFTKTDYGKGVYELAWELSIHNSTDDPVVNVTLFWCESAKERPVQCNGDIDWEHFSVDVHKHNVTLKKPAYQFAISANTARSSSGMQWAQCTIIHGRLGVIKNLRVEEAGQHDIKLSWMLDCHSQASVIEGYQIFYCAADSSAGDGSVRCRDKERSVIVPGDMHVKSGQLIDLDVNTSYRIAMSILAKNREQFSRSADLVASTAEGPPNVTDVRIHVLKVNNVSAQIEWNMPKVTHGKLRNYMVNYIGSGNDPVRVLSTETHVTLTKLRSYTWYNVSLVACTSICSSESTITSFQTDVGVPGVVDIYKTERNSSYVTIQWNPPKMSAGPSPIYELRVEKNDGKSQSYFTSSTEMTVPIPDCTSEKSRPYYVFNVRAMNGEPKMNDGVIEYPFTGNWSSALSVDCSASESNTVWKVLGWVSLPLVILLMFIYVGRKAIYRCKQMKSVQVTIPIKFTMPPPAYAPDLKSHDLFESYTSVSQIKSPDECRNLVEKSIDFGH